MRIWVRESDKAPSQAIYLATEFNNKHKLVTELAVEYTTNTSMKEFLGAVEQKVAGSGGKRKT